MDWASLEVLVAEEFRARAPGQMEPRLLPGDELSWLALMQHYGVPTRLLDFTFSPYVALYFAFRTPRRSAEGEKIRVWAIDIELLSRCFERVRAKGAEEERKRSGKKGKPISFHPDDFAWDRDVMRQYLTWSRKAVEEALSAKGTRRRSLNRTGCVGLALPSKFNPRLVNQQGLFLVNCAEEMTFEESLETMMAGEKGWLRVFDIEASLGEEIEGRLFQMNINEQSLFPDMEGLAGLIRQEIRLHW